MSSIQSIDRLRRLVLVFALLAVTIVPGFAVAQTEDHWTVSEATGEVLQRIGSAQWAPLKQGEVVPPGVAVKTGSNGRLVLSRSTEARM